MGAIPNFPRAGLVPALLLMVAMVVLPSAGSAEPWPHIKPSPTDLRADDAADSGVIEASLVRLPPTIGRSSLDAEVLCLARNIYWEAKSEPRIGKIAVAAVTLNRVADRRFPDTVCGVVDQRTGRSCQFRWACDGRRNATPSGTLWQESLAVAREALDVGHDDPTGGAFFFHGTRERTDWRGVRRLTTRIGGHVFYR